MNKDENKNKKLDPKELNNISGGKFYEEQHEKIEKLSEKIKKLIVKHPIVAYGLPNPLPNLPEKQPEIKIPEEPKNPDSTKVDALLPEKPENTEK